MDTLTLADVASELHLARSVARAYIASGQIPGGFQPIPGGRWLVDVTTYRAWRADRMAAVDATRIEPRSPRSRAAQNRKERS